MGHQSDFAEAISERRGGNRGQLSERADAQALERFGQFGERRARSEQSNRERGEKGARLLAIPGDNYRAAHPSPSRRRHGRKPRRRHAVASRHTEGSPSRGQYSLDPLALVRDQRSTSMQPQQASRVEADETGTLRLDRRPDRLQPHEQPLPHVGDAGGIGWHERQLGTACERLTQTHSGVYSERLRRDRNFSHLLDAAGLRGERRGRVQQLSPIVGCDRELKAREKDADDHLNRTHVRISSGWIPVVRSPPMGPSDITDIASQSVRTLRAFGQRIPRAGGLLAQSLEDAVKDRFVMITGASSGIGKAAAIELGKAGGTVLLVARSEDKLTEVKRQIEIVGGVGYVHLCDLSDIDDIDRMAAEVLEQHEYVDILVNNAGRSIRRSVSRAYDRFHDYQRTMQVNYFGPVKLILDLLPAMREHNSGHIVNVSTIGLQTNTPRFSAYLASKAALDAFSRSIAPEIIDDGVHVTTVYMPLVRTPMIAPTKTYDRFPTLSPEEAAKLITEAIRKRPKRIGSTIGTLGQLSYAVAPGAQDLVVNRAYKLFPEGGEDSQRESAEQRAFVQATRGVHW